MRITSITVRNYRIHRELRVELDPSRTVIGGLNETGKSTLVEAAHRALFLKARITGETQKTMVPKLHAGQPEVEVNFEAAGRTYRILKRFSGTTGTSTLTEGGGSTWQGDEAETRLAEILGVEATAGGRGAGERVAQQWAHLWVWQGEAGSDPAQHANAQRDSLLERLQKEGGGAAMQSECDARVAQVVAEQHGGLFNRNGEPKKDSELGRAVQEADSVAAEQADAQERFDRLEKALTDFQEAERMIRTCQSDLGKLRPELDVVEAKYARVSVLRAAEGIQQLAEKAAVGSHEALAHANEQILKLRATIDRHAAALAPKDAEMDRLKARSVLCADESKKAEEAHEKGTSVTRSLRLRHDLAEAHVSVFEKLDQRKQARAKLDQVRRVRKEVADLEAELAKLPDIDARRLRLLEKLDGERSNAEAALRAMAAGIEVIASDVVVKAGRTRIEVGEAHVLTEETDVSIGPKVQLRIKPGGGNSLSEARKHLRDSQASLKKGLDEIGVVSLEKATEAVARRRHYDKEIAAARGRLDGLGADTLEKECANAEQACLAAEADLKRRASAVEGFAAPTTLADAQVKAAENRKQLVDSGHQESSLKLAWSGAVRALKAAEATLTAHQTEVEGERKVLNASEAQIRLLLGTHGEDGERVQKLAALSIARTEAENRLSATRGELADLQPEMIEKDRTRLRRAIEQAERAGADAETKRVEARTLLQSDGTEDPQATLVVAKERARAAVERLTSVKRKAQAVQLLHRLFLDEQKALADRFTQPLAERISGYLRCLFGTRVKAIVKLENEAFGGIELAREGFGAGAFAFEMLSGGAKEQVAAAVRLAMAEVLAEGHDGCLPVVFDDAFAYSDPNRVQTLQRMLDHAASQGLQIIVLTCNPSDYAALGAKRVLLGAATGSPTSDPPVEMPAEQTDSPTESASEEPVIPVQVRVAEAQREAVLRTLQAEGGSMGNIALRKMLGWDEATYQSVKMELLAQGCVVAGKGKGGSLALVPGAAAN